MGSRSLRRLFPLMVCLALAVLAVTLVLAVVKWAPQWLSSTGDLKPNEAAEERGRIRNALLASLAGVLAALGAYYTHRTFGLNRAGQITERFTRAIDQLGSSELDVRLGGIYALERIARDSKADHPQVIEVLTAYVREHAPLAGHRPPAPAPELAEVSDEQLEAIRALERIATAASAEFITASTETPGQQAQRDDPIWPLKLPTDVQAAMSVLGRREPTRDRDGARFDIRRTDLRGVELRGDGANLQGAYLDGANLQGAHLDKANLQGAHLGGANLQGAYLAEANLKDAHLGVAKLQGAYLRRADLKDAHLGGADLEGVNLWGANLQDVYLGGANLQKASYDADTKWPEGFDLRAVVGDSAPGRSTDRPPI